MKQPPLLLRLQQVGGPSVSVSISGCIQRPPARMKENASWLWRGSGAGAARRGSSHWTLECEGGKITGSSQKKAVRIAKALRRGVVQTWACSCSVVQYPAIKYRFPITNTRTTLVLSNHGTCVNKLLNQNQFS